MKQIKILTGLVSLLFVPGLLRAQPAQHGSHSHGAALASIAIEGKKGKLTLETPASAIYGFEREAKSKADQMRKDRGLKKLQENIAQIFAFAESAKCELKLEVYEVQQQKSHADVHSEFSFECAEPLKGTELTVSIQKQFPKIKKLQVQVIMDDVQKSQEIVKDGEKIGLQ